LSDYLHRVSLNRDNARAQRFMTTHDFRKRLFQRKNVKLSAKSSRRRQIVKRTCGVDLIEEPETLLRKGQRKGVEFGGVFGEQRRKQLALFDGQRRQQRRVVNCHGCGSWQPADDVGCI
jgi:hypothetical protein